MQTIKAVTISILGIWLLAGSAVGAAAQDAGGGTAPQVPVAVSATTAPGPCPESTLESLPGGVTRQTRTCLPAWTWNDERLDGAVTLSQVTDTYDDGTGLTLTYVIISIENEGGSWRMRPLPQVEFPDAPLVNAEVYIMDGEGGYEGLTAVMLVEDFAPRGFLIDGDMPPIPELATE